MRRCAESLSPADVTILVKQAAADHLAVQFRPLIRVGPPSDWTFPRRSWEGYIVPPSSEKFAKSILAAERPYLEIARRYHVKQVMAGTELDGWKGTQWQDWLLAQERALCGCQVSLADSIQRLGSLPAGADGLDYYPHTTLTPGASQAAVTAAIEQPLDAVPASIRTQLTLTEESIMATAGAYRHPAEWNIGGRPDPQVQERWFTGMCQAAARYHLAGLYFYEIPLSDSISNPDPFPAFFVGTAAAKAIASCES
ncbi:MAG: hypothetical protein ACLPUO_28200 [Streptosporangiaceae bacterium]